MEEQEQEQEEQEHISVIFKPDFRVYTVVNDDCREVQAAATTSEPKI